MALHCYGSQARPFMSRQSGFWRPLLPSIAAQPPPAPSQYEEACSSRTSRLRVNAAEHSRYVVEVGMAAKPENIDTLLEVLKAQEQEIFPPNERSGLHPLAIPLARGLRRDGDADDAASGAPVYTCLLRWPQSASKQGLPVVSMRRGAPTLSLLARSVEEYLIRAIAEEDHNGGPGPIAAAAGAEGGRLYTAGSAATSKLPSLDAWLTRGAGMFPDVVESLVRGHLSRGDQMSALITSEWYMRPGHFPGWARPYEFNAELYRELGRGEEARDSARIALNMPWWTLGSGFQAIAALAELPADAAAVQKALSEELKATSGGPLPPGIGVATKTDQQLAVEEAENLMNTVAAGEAEWDEVRSDLAAKYEEGGQTAVADFIRAAM